MKKHIWYIITTLVAVLSLFSTCRPALAQDFIEGFEDLPTPQGTYQLQNDNVSFGNEESRFVEAYLGGNNTSFSAVADFYVQTLPQLGWVLKDEKNSHLVFERDEELLDIVCEQKLPLLIRITLKSKN